MKKRISIGLLVAFMPLMATAQLYQDASNSTAVVSRDPARQASTDVDAVIYNPAGMAFMKDGFHVSLNGNGSYAKVYERDGFYDPKTGEVNIKDGYNTDKVHKIIPSMQFSYKKNNLAVGFSIAEEGGFGHWNMPEGSIDLTTVLSSALYGLEEMEEVLGQELTEYFKVTNDVISSSYVLWQLYRIASFNSTEFPEPTLQPEDRATIASRNSNIHLFNLTPRLMFSYKVLPNLSFAAGVKLNRMTYTTSSGIITAVQRPSTFETWATSEYFGQASDALEGWISEHKEEAVSESVPDLIEMFRGLQNDYSDLESKTADPFMKGLNWLPINMKDWGLSPVIGIDFSSGFVNIGAKYEFQTKIGLKKEDKTTFNIPSTLSMGIDWKVLQNLNIALGGVMHFRTNNVLSAEESFTSKTCEQISVSGTWSPFERLSISAGETFSNLGVLTPATTHVPLAFENNRTWTTSMGVAFTIIDNLCMNVGFNYSLNGSHINYCSIIDIGGGSSLYPLSAHYFVDKFQAAIGLNYSF